MGDSYALGIAGTGGTSSPSSPPAELCKFRAFGVGSREFANVVLARIGIPVPNFNEFKLELEDTDMPDAKDFLFCSGVAQAEDGVMLFPKARAGESLKARSSNEASPWGVGGPTGPLGRFWFMDSLRNLRASVGLIVLAPNPDM